jgi:toxin secretion/phage lysis holin
MKDISIPAACKWIGAAVLAQWLAVPSMVRTLLLFMAADYATGLIAAIVRREVSSHVAWKGLAKKTCSLILLAVAHVAEKSAGLDVHAEQVLAIAFLVGEFISIIENAHRVGVPIPAPVVAALLAAKRLQPSATAEQLKALEEGQK